MSDLFKSALGYFSGTGTLSNNELVGQTVEVNSIKLRVKDVIAEGGFAFVYVAQTEGGKNYALKRLLGADSEANEAILKEVNILRKLSGHPNIIEFISACVVDKSSTKHGMMEHLLLTEYCQGGSLVNRLQVRGVPFNPEVVCSIAAQTCKAVQHMHSQHPAIIHFDLKIENLLLTADGKVKLCDFGSATTEIFKPDNSWSAQRRALLEDKICSRSTPMYRSPEMVDSWANHEIGLGADIWAVGCIIYLLCYNCHPFQDSAKLRIMNANYTLPSSDSRYRPFHQPIKGCLVEDPRRRMTITDVLECLAAISETNNYSLSAPVPIETKEIPQQQGVQKADVNQQNQHRNNVHNQQQQQAPRAESASHDLPSSQVHAASHRVSGGGGLFSQLKGGAGSLLKNLKDTSSKVVQTVQQTMGRGEEMAAGYITSRVCVINYTDGPECLHDMRCLIESRHRLANVAIYNLSPTTFPPYKFPNATIVEGGWGNRCPSLQALYTLCQHMEHFLSSHSSHVAVITCPDGKTNSAMLVCGFLLYVALVSRPVDALQVFAVKRTPPTLQPSHMRYLKYFSSVLEDPQPTLCLNKVKLVSLIIQPVPLYNKVRDGCRPFIEVYQGEDKIFSSLDDYDRLTVFTVSHAKVVLPVGCGVCGDVTIAAYHARQVLGRITPIKMFKLQVSTAFLPNKDHIVFNKQDLDETGEEDRLTVTLTCDFESGSGQVCNAPWANHKPPHLGLLFTSKLEADETIENFVASSENGRKQVKPARPDGPPCRPAPKQAHPARPPAPKQAHPARPPAPNRTPSPVCREEKLVCLGSTDVAEAERLLDPEEDSGVGALVDLLSLGEEPAFRPPAVNAFQPPPKPNIALNENFLGDWSETSNSDKFSNIIFNNAPTSGTPVTSNNLLGGGPPLSTPSVGLNKIHSAGNLKTMSGIQRNVSYPNLKTDPFEEFITGQKSLSTANSPAKTPNDQPNYNRSNFENIKPQQQDPGSGKKPEDVFGDLLGSQGYSFSSKKDIGPKTINQMRRSDQVKVLDPDQIKLMDWTEGKKGNIRALLTSMHAVVWSEAKWPQCHMSQLVSAADVKKMYRKACIAVHPDKNIGTENEKIAKMIFMELNNAWSDFEKENH